MSTNYKDTFITASPDSVATQGKEPAAAHSVAGMQYALLREKPYTLTSDDLLFKVHARRNNIADAEHQGAREAFFSKPQACLRASPLVKKYGWGLHHDGDGRVAAYGVGTDTYEELPRRSELKVVAGMRSRKA